MGLVTLPSFLCANQADPPPSENKPLIVKMPLASPQLTYVPYQEGSLPTPQNLLDIPTLDGQKLTPFSLPEDRAFVPVQMEVQKATDARGEMPPRVCLLGRDRATWRVYTIGPSAPEAPQGGEGDEHTGKGKAGQIQTPNRGGDSI